MTAELLPLDSEYYGIALQKYVKYRRVDGPLYQGFLEHQLPVVVGKVWPQGKASLALASFGCGDGRKDIDLLEALVRNFSTNPTSGEISLFVRALDPCKDSLEVYKSRYEINGALFLPQTLKSCSTLEFEFWNQTFQIYATYAQSSRRNVDVVLFASSLYYMPMETALMHAYNQELGQTGVIVIDIAGENSPFTQVAQILKKNASSDFVFHHAKSSKDIVKIAEKNKWAYEEFPIPLCQDVTDILDKDSEEGNMALDFLTYCKDFRVTGGKECVTKVDSLIRNLSEEENGRRYISYSIAVVVIYKGQI